MSFSTGVMIYLSFMDIMYDTQTKVGDYASIAFFIGMGMFMALEVCLPEVEGTQFAEVLGFTAWQPSPEGLKPAVVTSLEERIVMKDAVKKAPASPVKTAGMRQRPNAKGNGDPPSSPQRSASSPKSRRRSPPPSERRKTFEAHGESGLTERRKKSISFSGMMVLVSISLHNIPEGIAVYLTCLKGIKSGLPLAIAMSLHNIPEGMAVAGPLYAATKSKSKAVFAATASGMFEVVGCILVQIFFDQITPFFMDVMLSLVAGIMVALALIELLPSCLEVLSPKMMGCSCVGGMAFMFLSKSISHELVAKFT